MFPYFVYPVSHADAQDAHEASSGVEAPWTLLSEAFSALVRALAPARLTR
jgi:hypothetical protein